MTIENRLRLSFYREIAVIDEAHHVTLVQHVESHHFFVKKELSVYNPAIYTYLKTHPIKNTPYIHECIEDDDHLIVIEEYISGQTLQELLDHNGTLPENQVLDYSNQLCGILEQLHACTPAIIHRDIKPSNIILTPDGTIKLLDLNAAKYVHTDALQKQDTHLIGTHGFAAPEQYGFGVSNTKTDIYSVGILMNTLLTGEVSHECTTISKLAPVIRRCILLDPENRFASIAEVRQAILKCSGRVPAKKESETTENAKSKKPAPWMRFLPPGFRTMHPANVCLASLGYLLIFWMGSGMTIENVYGAKLVLERSVIILIFLSIVFFSSNYLNIHDQLPLCNSGKKPIRIFGILLWNCLIFVLWVLILIIIENFFFS